MSPGPLPPLILCVTTLHFHHFCQPARHGAGELLAVLVANLCDPDVDNFLLQHLHRGHLLVLQPPLHQVPHVLDRIEVWRVAWPIHNRHPILSQPCHGLLALMAWRPILQELGVGPALVPRQHVGLQGVQVLLGVHGHILWQEPHASPSMPPIKSCPDHHRPRMLHGLYRESLVKPVTLPPPHSLGSPPDKLEAGLVREHDVQPVLLRPVQVILSKLQPLLFHGRGEQWLSGSLPCRISCLLQDFLNPPY